MKNYRYFISGKTFFNYNSEVTSTTVFGQISISPVVYDASGNLLAVGLYAPLGASPALNLKPSRSYLDLDGANSYHNTGFKIGNAQVITMGDDKTLSSTANAMKEFFTGTNNTVGIVPDLGTSQQLIFLIQNSASDIFPSTGGT